MKLSELQKKDIVDIKTGRKIGKIVDIEFDISSGYMIKFIIESNGILKNIFSSNEDIVIRFSQIKKLGEDVILIDIS